MALSLSLPNRPLFRLAFLNWLVFLAFLSACARQNDSYSYDVIERSRVESPDWLDEVKGFAGSGVFALKPGQSEQRFVVLRRQVRDIKLVINQEQANLLGRFLRQNHGQNGMNLPSLNDEPQILDIYYEKQRDFTNPLAASGFDLYVLVALREDRPSPL